MSDGTEYKHRMELSGKIAVVTGASMGIGEALAKAFVDLGARIVVLSRDATRAEAARARIGNLDHTIALSCDVRHREEIDRVISLTLHHFQRIDIWVNNAGHGLDDSISSAQISACRETFDTNFFGALECIQAVVPVMREQQGGTIINISSVAGHIPVAYKGIYSATKFALNAVTNVARIELSRDNIHVLNVCPGYVRTDFGKNALKGAQLKSIRPASQKGISSERVARAVVNAYLRQKREIIVPWYMHIPVKVYQLFPWVVDRAMLRMVR
jgi:uncharacterized protein